uniref:Alpha-macroglobulin receptor-binding domain-containing protein n=1 Tax=Megaselia scalaris TaxID=36166 RepID=T1GCH7_MEGSC
MLMELHLSSLASQFHLEKMSSLAFPEIQCNCKETETKYLSVNKRIEALGKKSRKQKENQLTNNPPHFSFVSVDSSVNNSNLAVMEVELPSGFVVDMDTLPSLEGNERITVQNNAWR